MASGTKPKNIKKTGRYVSSRYLEASEKISVQTSNSREKSTLTPNSQNQHLIQREGASGCSKLSLSGEYRGLTSTPAPQGEFKFLSLDASVVTNKGENFSIPHLKEGIVIPMTMDVKRNLLRKNKVQNETINTYGPVIASRKGKKFEYSNEKLAEAEMDIIYAQYLQAAFLQSEAMKTLNARSSYNLEYIYKFFNLVLLNARQLNAQEQKLQLFSIVIKIQEHCQKREEIFKPLFEIIPTVEKQYQVLAEAVNATKHKLHIKDVLVPEPGCEGEVIELLEKMKTFIGSFLHHFSNVNEISISADILKNYIGTAELISDALKKGLTLLTDAKDLLLSEATLLSGCKDL